MMEWYLWNKLGLVCFWWSKNLFYSCRCFVYRRTNILGVCLHQGSHLFKFLMRMFVCVRRNWNCLILKEKIWLNPILFIPKVWIVHSRHHRYGIHCVAYSIHYTITSLQLHDACNKKVNMKVMASEDSSWGGTFALSSPQLWQTQRASSAKHNSVAPKAADQLKHCSHILSWDALLQSALL